jgi:hypothetical protein
MEAGMGMFAPQLEQKRALWGNWVPQRLQKTAMIRFLPGRLMDIESYEESGWAVPFSDKDSELASAARRWRVSKLAAEAAGRRRALQLPV